MQANRTQACRVTGIGILRIALPYFEIVSLHEEHEHIKGPSVMHQSV
jgi:hypothetical protein